MGGRLPKWIVLLFALSVGSTLAGTVFLSSSLWRPGLPLLGDQSSDSVLNNILISAPIAAMICIPVGWVMGYPVLVGFYLQRMRTALEYCIAGVLTSLFGGWLILGALGEAPENTFFYMVGWRVVAGAVGGLATWLIRRPDRDVRERDRAPPGAHGDERSDAGV